MEKELTQSNSEINGLPPPAKRYFLFASPKFYPQGGWKDYKWESDSIEELKRIFTYNCVGDEFEWSEGHIFDWLEKKIICEVSSDRKWIINANGLQKESDLEIVWSTKYS